MSTIQFGTAYASPSSRSSLRVPDAAQAARVYRPGHFYPDPRDPLTRKKDFSGKFVLRVEPGLHRRLAAKALASGDSLNAFCKKALVKE
jgi:hypothetical protein